FLKKSHDIGLPMIPSPFPGRGSLVFTNTTCKENINSVSFLSENKKNNKNSFTFIFFFHICPCKIIENIDFTQFFQFLS
ncbi:hypothetical protein, partial [Bacillus smithii]|uniref:hypothetical protein n=1 Tax=Bacillus smithii TaxID=1479 RepID=UPI0030C9941E